MLLEKGSTPAAHKAAQKEIESELTTGTDSAAQPSPVHLRVVERRTQMDATTLLLLLLLPSAASRAPTVLPMVQSATTRLLRVAHLAVVCRTRPCTWKAVDEAVSASSLKRELCFVTSSVSYVRCHDLRLQGLVELLRLLLRFRLLFERFD
jgi:hypothetical protein